MDIVLENYLMPVEYGLSSKIYFLAYEKPKSAYEISFEIYDKYHHSIITKINELKEDNFFMPVTIKGKKHPKWLSSIEPLISMIYFIKEKDKVSFTELEKHILAKLLNSEAFRIYTSNKQIYKQIRGDFNSIDFILMKLDCLAIEYLSSKAICEIGIIIDKKIKNKEQYDNFIKESLESSSMEDLIDVISDGKEYYREVKKKPIPKWFENKQVLQELFHVYNKMKHCIYVPKSLMEKIKGVSEFGQMEPVLKKLYNEAYEMDSFVNFLISKGK